MYQLQHVPARITPHRQNIVQDRGSWFAAQEIVDTREWRVSTDIIASEGRNSASNFAAGV
jgi:hypothetical protein